MESSLKRPYSEVSKIVSSLPKKTKQQMEIENESDFENEQSCKTNSSSSSFDQEEEEILEMINDPDDDESDVFACPVIPKPKKEPPKPKDKKRETLKELGIEMPSHDVLMNTDTSTPIVFDGTNEQQYFMYVLSCYHKLSQTSIKQFSFQKTEHWKFHKGKWYSPAHWYNNSTLHVFAWIDVLDNENIYTAFVMKESEKSIEKQSKTPSKKEFKPLEFKSKRSKSFTIPGQKDQATILKHRMIFCSAAGLPYNLCDLSYDIDHKVSESNNGGKLDNSINNLQILKRGHHNKKTFQDNPGMKKKGGENQSLGIYQHDNKERNGYIAFYRNAKEASLALEIIDRKESEEKGIPYKQPTKGKGTGYDASIQRSARYYRNYMLQFSKHEHHRQIYEKKKTEGKTKDKRSAGFWWSYEDPYKALCDDFGAEGKEKYDRAQFWKPLNDRDRKINKDYYSSDTGVIEFDDGRLSIGGSPDENGSRTIRVDGDLKFVYVLVCASFNGFAPSSNHVCAHKNNKYIQYSYTDLEWQPQSQNMGDAIGKKVKVYNKITKTEEFFDTMTLAGDAFGIEMGSISDGIRKKGFFSPSKYYRYKHLAHLRFELV